MSISSRELYNLLPAVHRVRDTADGEPLRALLAILAEQGKKVERDVAQLYDNWFIETCEEWVVPYLGDLVGLRGLHTIAAAGFSQRARAANVLRYRRRKGTATMLEQLARDTTGWNSRAVEFFERVGWSQHLQHIRLESTGTPDLRRTEALELLGGPFEEASHTIDVRRIAIDRGRYNIMNVGIFLWRLQSYYLAGSSARAIGNQGAGSFTFNPVGIDRPLFNRPRTELEITRLAGEMHVPGPLRRRPLYEELEQRRQAVASAGLTWGFDAASFGQLADDGVPQATRDALEPLVGVLHASRGDFLAAATALLAAAGLGQDAVTAVQSQLLARAVRVRPGDYFGEQSVFEIRARDANGGPLLRIPPEEVLICDMIDGWRPPPATREYAAAEGETALLPIRVSVDPLLGRLAFRPDEAPVEVVVAYASGFSGDLGGGPYDRRESASALVETAPRWQIGVTRTLQPVEGQIAATLGDAVREWNERPPGTTGLIVLLDNYTYEEELDGANAIVLAAGSSLAIVAAGWPEPRIPGRIEPDDRRAHIVGDIEVRAAAGSRIVFDGLLLEGGVDIVGIEGEGLRALGISHCTVVPGSGTLQVSSADPGFTFTLRRSIIPALVASPDTTGAINAIESIIDGEPNAAIDAPSVTLTIRGCTVFGAVAVRCLEMDGSIVTGAIDATRKQSGCARFSYVLPGSRTPRRFRCQPDYAVAQGLPAEADATRSRVVPAFTSRQWGDPAYAQLDVRCPAEIRTGADDGSEMGAFGFLKQPQRESNLRSSLDEYLGIGLEAGLIFVT